MLVLDPMWRSSGFSRSVEKRNGVSSPSRFILQYIPYEHAHTPKSCHHMETLPNGDSNTHMRIMTGYSTASELANENGSIVWCLAILGGLANVTRPKQKRASYYSDFLPAAEEMAVFRSSLCRGWQMQVTSEEEEEESSNGSQREAHMQLDVIAYLTYGRQPPVIDPGPQIRLLSESLQRSAKP